MEDGLLPSQLRLRLFKYLLPSAQSCVLLLRVHSLLAGSVKTRQVDFFNVFAFRNHCGDGFG